MKISALASGSSGNAFYIENDSQGILIDSGISAKQTFTRLIDLKVNPENLKAIFITHEHSDHIKGADVLARTLNIPIFSTKKTANNCFLCSNSQLINYIKNDESINICGMNVQAFSKSHKAADPVSYSILKEKKISVITDIGFISQNVADNISDSDFLCIEANHDISMLEKGPYPFYLKEWIKSDVGHLSNLQSALGIFEHSSGKLKNILLSHLSQTNNTSQIALKTFKSILERRDLHINLSNSESPAQLFKI